MPILSETTYKALHDYLRIMAQGTSTVTNTIWARMEASKLLDQLVKDEQAEPAPTEEHDAPVEEQHDPESDHKPRGRRRR